ncbi:hypothetical protein ACSFA2_03590 [Variovorax sp. LT2P21]|uniref:hypothetical protein n=1 Tax=Variovorax sp. LT2P21 TaxID=3443731 RepID=UPI003F44678B
MRIADQIALVSREFVSGDDLLDAVAKQEGVTRIQAASWFLRQQAALDALPMLTYHRERRDFRQVDTPWSGDVFRDFGSSHPEELDWDPDGDGYVGGWLASHLKKFFSETGVPFPETSSTASSEQAEPAVQAARATSVQSFLAANGSDFMSLSDWLKSFGSGLRRTSMALRLAIEQVGGFVPIYARSSSEFKPEPLELAEAADLWADILTELHQSEMIPDVLSVQGGQELWLLDLYVRDTDCAEFLRLAGLPHEQFDDLNGGVIAKGVLDFEAAARREQEPTLRLPGSVASQPSATAAEDQQLSARERNGLLRIIGALLSVVFGDMPGIPRHPSVASEAELIRLLDQHFDGFEGLSASNLSRKFPQAKRLLRS